MIKAIFWDMDGTMVDSEPQWGIATYELSEAMGRRLTPELRELTVGSSLPRTMRLCAEHAGITLSDADYERYRAGMFARVHELFDESLVPNPGVTELLTELKALEIPMLVTTNTERDLATRSVAAVGNEFFIGSIAGDEVPTAKPAPDMYLEAARRVGFDPSECLVFEDSYNGMLGAVTAGCRVIGLHSEEVQAPEGVVPLRSLHGKNSFEGVTAEMVTSWYHQIEPAGVAK
ncbi:HAD family hydrolase [Corynebacterium glutamicum]|uniref:HAD family hydrolase n=1 Tax=Corynebacterium glutamicum TaxID=1718 RepID=UPI00117F7E9E|nr:HAD family phosphatase [Corynebacterium glutamicum]QDQ20951.1 HAD family phosphatase [Corynebacterium glutamicum]QDQ24521.1 HAD family phosphatase [Corynebacterium glutamicum]